MVERIRLLTSVQGDGPVVGDVGDILDVADEVAAVWADGERAERVPASSDPVATRVAVSPAPTARRRTRGGRPVAGV